MTSAPDLSLAPPRNWLDSREAAAYVGVPWETFRHVFRRWGIPSYKIGRCRSFRQDELDSWLASRRDEPGAA